MTVSYLKPILDIDNFPNVVEHLGHQISKDYKDGKFDALIVTGLSGVILASAISYQYRIPLIVVRKGESTHSSLQVEGYNPNKHFRVAFLDDFISSGKTLKRVLDLTENMLEIVQGYFYLEYSEAETLKDLDKEILNAYFPDLDFPIFSVNYCDKMHELEVY